MIQKMPTDNCICNICKKIAKAIPKIEKNIASLEKQYDKLKNSDPILLQQARANKARQIALCTSQLRGLKEGYEAILGVEYGSEQTHDAYKPQMNEYVFCTLNRRGIMKVEYKDIEPRNGKPYVRLYWTEKVE